MVIIGLQLLTFVYHVRGPFHETQLFLRRRFKMSSFLALISKHVSGMMEPREACIRSMLLSGIPLAVT